MGGREVGVPGALFGVRGGRGDFETNGSDKVRSRSISEMVSMYSRKEASHMLFGPPRLTRYDAVESPILEARSARDGTLVIIVATIDKYGPACRMNVEGS